MAESLRSQKESTAHNTFPLWVKVSFIALTVIKLWLVDGQTIFAIGYAMHDDRLFLNLASALLSGDWLGPYNNLTLAKSPFYPLWIAVTFILGIPLLLSQHLLYVAACAIFVIAVRPLMSSPTILLFGYAILLFNPITYTDDTMTRVLREGIYPGLTILVSACAIGLLLRHARPLKILAFWATGLGVALSALWLTREEGVWIMPSILIIVGFAALRIWQTKSIDWRRLSLLSVLPFVIWVFTIGFVAGINKIYYGVFTTLEMKSRDFLSAYGALSRVKHIHWQPYIPVPKETRERIYQISPAFAELRPFLEGDIGKGWSVHGCKSLSVCEDIAGGWFMWALRDAVATAGYYSSAESAANYYRRMATEINTACAGRYLDCESERTSLMPPWRSEYIQPLLNTAVHAAVFLSRFENFSANSSPSKGPDESLALFRDLTRERLSPPNEVQIIGWLITRSKASAISLTVRTSNGDLIDASIKLRSSPDMNQHFFTFGKDLPNDRKLSFEIITPCAEGCYLNAISGDRLLASLPLDGSMLSRQTPELQLHLDFWGYKKGNILKYQSRIDDLKIKILNQTGKAYQTVMPTLIGLALLAYTFSVVQIFRKRIIARIWVINTSLLIAILARLLIFSMIHVTSFPGINIQYLSPAYPLLLVFTVLAFVGCKDHEKTKGTFLTN